MDSPFIELREKKNMIQGQFAMLLDCSKSLLSDLERGLVDISPRIKENLSKLGIDSNEFEKKHKEYVENKKEELRKQFMEE